MSTPHINSEVGQIAKTVLMPGDPLRAKYIAETFLDDVQLVNEVRNMFAFTGTYKGRRITVMGSGMGMPSIGIYSYELFKFYGVERIIRIGSCGAYSPDLKLYDTILATRAYSESSFAKTQNGYEKNYLEASKELNAEIERISKEIKIPVIKGNIHSSDVFYRQDTNVAMEYAKENNLLGVEMESFALFHNSRLLNKQAACLLTVSDSLVTHEATTAEERQTAFTNMMKIALELAE